MKQQARELLVTTKAAQRWQEDFEQKVDELIFIVNSVDNDDQVERASETLDVYHRAPQKAKKGRKKKLLCNERPFEFLVFRN